MKKVKIPTRIKATRAVKVEVENGEIVVDPDVLHMGKVIGQAVEWTVVTSGWNFPLYANGIALKVNHHDFSNGHKVTSKVFRISNLNSVRRSHRYKVTLVNGSGDVLQKDPSIVNRG